MASRESLHPEELAAGPGCARGAGLAYRVADSFPPPPAAADESADWTQGEIPLGTGPLTIVQ